MPLGTLYEMESHTYVIGPLMKKALSSAGAVANPKSQKPTRPVPSPITSEAVSPRGRARILLVDDDPTVRGSLSEVLVTEGYVIVPAVDGQQAIELARSAQFDLVLLDLNMPVKNGWDTFEQLTREHPLLPVIILTARPNQLFTAVGAGVGALLEKPLDIPTLLRTARRLLAESPETRLARLAGRETEFHYSAGMSELEQQKERL